MPSESRMPPTEVLNAYGRLAMRNTIRLHRAAGVELVVVDERGHRLVDPWSVPLPSVPAINGRPAIPEECLVPPPGPRWRADDPLADLARRAIAAAGGEPVAVYLYGSRARNTARATSDWDLAIVLRGALDDWAATQRYVESFFATCTFPVDVRVFGEDEFYNAVNVPGTLPRAIALSHDVLYEREGRMPRVRARVD